MKEKISKEKRPKSVLPILQKIFSENSIKFNMEWENEDGERVGTMIVTPTEREKKVIIKDPEQLMWWTWEKMIRNMYKLQEGSQYVPELKEIDIIEFILPDDLVYKKFKNKTLLKRIEKEIRSVYGKENFHFKVMLTTDKEEIIIE